MYAPSDVSEMLDIRPSTLRYYCAKYSDLLSPTAAPTGKKRRFNDQDIITLHKIKHLTRQKKTPDEIRQLINLVDDTPPQDTALSLLPMVQENFEQIRAQLATLQDKQDKTAEQLARTAEQLAKLQEWINTPWFKRVGRKPPNLS